MQFINNFIYRTPINHLKKQSISDEMIYLASTNLLKELKKSKANEKIKLSIKKYIQRASSRCTPFGMFAGCGVGQWSEKEHGIITDNYFSRQTRLDMNVICEMADFFSKQACIKKQLKYFPNNSSYKIADKIRYVEFTFHNKIRNYQITEIQQNAYINEILDEAKNGISYNKIVIILLKYEVTELEAQNFIDELISSQLIFCSLYPNVTGEVFFKRMINILKKINSRSKIEEVCNYIILLEQIESKINALDNKSINTVESYTSIFNLVKEILPNIIEENLFQTDLYYHHEIAYLNQSIQSKILDTMNYLSKLYPPYSSESLVKFKENFIKRYENQEKGLLEVLDKDCGIGFKSKDTIGINILVDDFISPETVSKKFDLNWNATNSLLLKKLLAANKNNEKVVAFIDEDIKDFNLVKNTFPPTMAVFFSMLASEGKELCFSHAVGSSASNLLGRFTHGHKKIFQIIKETTDYEFFFYNHNIIAEILHLPESRSGNFLIRSHTHSYEIPYLALSTKDKDHILELSDLYVSIVNDKVILRSKKLNKEIIPRLTTAHNYEMSTLPVYQFLCELQNQHYTMPSLGFNWGVLASEFEFLPRAVYKDVIISPATWHVAKAKFEKVLQNIKEYSLEEIQEWQNQLELPSSFLLSDGDNELLVDVNDELSVKAFLSTIKNRDSITLKEFLFSSDDSYVKDAQGNGFTNELIAILHNQEIPEIDIKTQANKAQDVKFQSNYILGSEWLYYKIYCSTKTAETILINSIYPFVLLLQQNKEIEKWFFIRYADPDPHIRLRFKMNDLENIAAITRKLNAILSPLLESALVANVINDTYSREIERYGSKSIDLTETLFGKDSLFILKLINEINDDEQGDLIKMKYACYHTILLIQLFGFSDDDLLQQIDRGRLVYFTEHGGNKELKLQLDNKYRKYRKEIDSFLNEPELKSSEENIFVFDLVQSYFDTIKPIIKNLKLIIETENEINLQDYIFSLIHMHVNRLFKSKQRTYELLMYDFLQRSLKSINARKLKNNSLRTS